VNSEGIEKKYEIVEGSERQEILKEVGFN